MSDEIDYWYDEKKEEYFEKLQKEFPKKGDKAKKSYEKNMERLHKAYAKKQHHYIKGQARKNKIRFFLLTKFGFLIRIKNRINEKWHKK